MRVDALYCIVAILCSGAGGCVAVSSNHTTGNVNDPGCVALAYAQALSKDDFREAARYLDEDSSRFLIRLANILTLPDSLPNGLNRHNPHSPYPPSRFVFLIK